MIDYKLMWQVLDDIQDERERQDQKWNDPPDWSNFDDATRFAVLFEETGEVARAYLENGPASEQLREELVQVAAVAVKWIERLDALKARELTKCQRE
jgi:NTP pyrophosphatase (non-canonical NTP hydrolase)